MRFYFSRPFIYNNVTIFATKTKVMNVNEKKITEARIIKSQNKYWAIWMVLYIVESGSVYNCYNEAAYVVASLTGYRLRKKNRKDSIVYMVTFPKDNIDKVMNIIKNAGCSSFRKIGRVITFQWIDDVPEVDEIWNVVAKDIRFELRLDSSTALQLKQIVEKGGFGGREKATKSEVLRYAVKHFYDNKPVDIKEAEPLIKAISGNRKELQEGLYTLTKLVKELNAIGVNLNQITHKINYLQQKAEYDAIPLGSRADSLLKFAKEIESIHDDLYSIFGEISTNLEPARDATLSAMEGENEIMNRLLI